MTDFHQCHAKARMQLGMATLESVLGSLHLKYCRNPRQSNLADVTQLEKIQRKKSKTAILCIRSEK